MQHAMECGRANLCNLDRRCVHSLADPMGWVVCSVASLVPNPILWLSTKAVANGNSPEMSRSLKLLELILGAPQSVRDLAEEGSGELTPVLS
jgi:hypothetical protein